MSHFAILVIGENVDEQLLPYHEFECTGIDQFIINVDLTSEFDPESDPESDSEQSPVDQAMDYYSRPVVKTNLTAEEITDDYINSLVSAVESNKYGIIFGTEDGQIVKIIQRTNPNAKWDWYQEGGRWSGFLLNKNDERVNSGIKRDIDFEAMRNEAGEKAGSYWDKANSIIGGRKFMTWAETWVNFGGKLDDIEEPTVIDVPENFDSQGARDFYNDQEVVKDFKESREFGFFAKPDDYMMPREAFVQEARDSATTLYAFVKDGEWVGRGEMGCFGMSNDKISVSDWNRSFNEMLDTLPDDTLITVIDCHI